METQVRTPQMVFMQPQRFVVPLFQRPYVWNQRFSGSRFGKMSSALRTGCLASL